MLKTYDPRCVAKMRLDANGEWDGTFEEMQMKLKHTVTLTLYTEADFDAKYCLDDCPMMNLEGYPHDCDLLKCDLPLVNTATIFKFVRDPRCPWKCEGIAE